MLAGTPRDHLRAGLVCMLSRKQGCRLPPAPALPNGSKLGETSTSLMDALPSGISRPIHSNTAGTKHQKAAQTHTWLMDALPSGVSKSIHSNTASIGAPSSRWITSRACSAGMGGTCAEPNGRVKRSRA